jgi:predicted Fe-S protein YdhL (DUF1289 family)
MPAAKVREPRRDRDGLIRCRVCGCTERDACDPPCSWVEDDLCSGCHDAVSAIAIWQLGARRNNRTALLREVETRLRGLAQ